MFIGRFFHTSSFAKTLEPQKLLRVNLAVVDRRAVLVHVEADVLAAPERVRMAGHQMLGRVDLHARKARFPVKLARHFRAGDERSIAEMDDLALFLARIRHAHAAERAGIAALSAAPQEEGGAVERYGVKSAAPFAR